MKAISRLLRYDDRFLDEKIPEQSRFLPDPSYDYPFFFHEGFMSEEECDALVADTLANGYRKPATVGDGALSNEIRKTDYLMPGLEFRKRYLERANQIKPEIEAFFGMRLEETGETQTYGYPPSGHYILHADDSNRQYNEKGELTHWKLTNPNRAISIIFYLTDSVSEITRPNQCIGGNLSFEYLLDQKGESFLLEPKKGLYIAFPSNPYFSHRVHEIFEGYRVVIVNWFKRVG